MSSTHFQPARSPVALVAWFLIANCALQLLDVASTFLALQAGGFEANPLSRHAMDHWGAFTWAAIKAVLALMFLAFIPYLGQLSHRDLKAASAALGVFCFAMTFVVVNNLWIFTAAAV